MSMSYHITQLVPRGTAVFLLKRLIFSGNGKTCHSLVFTVLQMHIKIKCLRIQVSVAVFRLRLQVTFLLLPDRSFTGSTPDGIQLTYLFSLILN